MAFARFVLLLATASALHLPAPVRRHCAPAALADNPLGSFFGGLANALESALDAASGGQQSLINDAEAALNNCAAATALHPQIPLPVAISVVSASLSPSSRPPAKPRASVEATA